MSIFFFHTYIKIICKQIYLEIVDKNYIKKQLKKSLNINLVEDVFEKANDNNGSQN